MNSDRANNLTLSHPGCGEILKTDNMSPLPTVEPVDQVIPQLSQGVVVLTKRSLIDSVLARACSLKRSRVEQDGAQPSLKRCKSQANLALTNQGQGSAARTVSSSSDSSVSSDSSSGSETSKRFEEDVCPYAFIESLLIGKNDTEPAKLVEPLHETEFLPPTKEQIDAYSTELLMSVRNCDVDALRRLHSEGHDLRCCNRFGESLLHAACRRSSPAMVKFLLEEAGVSPRIKDDYGRTPLHDACWHASPQVEIVELVLKKEPRLAFVRDVRGHRPFQYSRREHWGVWRKFLGQRKDLLLS